MSGVLSVRTFASGSSANLAVVRTRHTSVLLDLEDGGFQGPQAVNVILGLAAASLTLNVMEAFPVNLLLGLVLASPPADRSAEGASELP